MTVDVAEHVTDPDGLDSPDMVPGIGVHIQDDDGICVALGNQPWVHLSWRVSRVLADSLDYLLKARGK